MPDGVMQGVIWAVCHICKLRLWQWEMVKLILYGLVYYDEQTSDLIEWNMWSRVVLESELFKNRLSLMFYLVVIQRKVVGFSSSRDRGSDGWNSEIIIFLLFFFFPFAIKHLYPLEMKIEDYIDHKGNKLA